MRKLIFVLIVLLSMPGYADFKELWTIKFDNGERFTSPLLDEKNLYFHISYASYPRLNRFYAYDRANGTMVWVKDYKTHIDGILGPENNIVTGNLLAFRADNGTLLWNKSDDIKVQEGLVLAPDGRTLYASNFSGILSAYDQQTGNRKWSISLTENGSNFEHKPTVANDGTIYLTDTKGTLYAVAPHGKLQWQRRLNTCPLYAPVIDNHLNRAYIISACPKASSYDTDHYQIISVSLQTQQIDWKTPYDHFTAKLSQLILSPTGNLYFVYNHSTLGGVYAYQPDGELLWKHPVSTHLMPNIFLSKQNHVFFAKEDYLYELNELGQLVSGSYIHIWNDLSNVVTRELIYDGKNDALYAFATDQYVYKPQTRISAFKFV